MKRPVSIGFVVMWVFGMFLVLCIVPSSNVSANDPNPMGGGLYITSGDWTVDATSTLTTFGLGETVVVNGDLTITSGYTLTFEGANLQMNCPTDGAYDIIVQSGGTLIIKDIDSIPTTIGDRSIVNSSTPDGAHRFGFIVEAPNGELSLTNSELSDCGWEENPAINWQSSGLWIGTTNPIYSANIAGNYIHDCVTGVMFYNSVGGTISNNDFEQCEYSGVDLNATANVVVDGNTFTTCGNDIDLSYSLHGWADINADILNNVVENQQYFGIFMEDQTDLTMDGNIVRDTLGWGAGIAIFNFNGDTYATNNEAYNISWSGLFLDGMTGATSNTYVNNNTIHDIYIDETWAGVTGLVLQNLLGDRTWVEDNDVFNLGETGANLGVTSGISIYMGSGHNLIRNTVYGISDLGVRILSDNVIVDDCDIYSNGDSDSGWEPDSGVFIYDVSNTVIKNSRIYDNYPPIPGINDVYGILIYDSPNTLVHNCDILDNDINIMGYGDGFSSNDALIENCTMSLAFWSDFEFDLDLNSDFTTLNTTFDNSSININDAGSTLTCKWFLHVQTREFGSGVDGADVWVNDTFGSPDPSSGQPFTTQTMDGEPGWVRWIPVTEFVETDVGKTYYTPHTINATLPGKGGMVIPNMWKSQEVVINLNNFPVIIDFQIQGGASSGYRGDSIFIIINANDVEDSEDMLVIYVEYRVNDTAPWETAYLLGAPVYMGSPPSGYWEIEFIPPTDAPLGWYDFRVRVEDSYPSSSAWWVEDNMLEVLNNPPWVVSTSNTSAQVFRGDSIFVLVVGDDVEDQQDWFICEIQYRAPSGSWSGPDTTLGTPLFVPNSWRAEFTPQATPTKDEIGMYDFRFRFQDTDGTWSTWYVRPDWIEVLNNPPLADSLDAGEPSVYRNAPGTENNFTWLFANVTEIEDTEDTLTVLFEYMEPGVPGWQSTYIDHTFTLTYDSGAGLWKVKFIPPDTAAVGFYNFRVTFTDIDGDNDSVTGNGLLQVLNNIPTAIDITPSQTSIRAGVANLLRIKVNATDVEDDESELTIGYGDIQWQFNGPTGGDRPGEAGWKSTWFDASGYDPTSGGHLWVEFEPDEDDATPGVYGFRVKVTDPEGDKSDPWLIIYDAVEVLSPKPEIEYVTPETNDVFRGEQLIIRMSGLDAVDPEDQLTPHLEYRKKGTSTWIVISGSASFNSSGGYWEVYWTPSTALDLGLYEFQGRFNNTDGVFSDYMAGDFDVTVRNNLPLALDLGVVGAATYVNRGDSITLYANGFDEETPEDLLIAYFEYMAPGDTWDNTYFSGLTYNNADNRWEIDFELPTDADLGDYDFRVRFRDGDNDDSGYIEQIGFIEVRNVPPIAIDISVDPITAYIGDTIIITANGADADGTEGALTVTIEYRSPSGSWTPVPGSVNYVGISFRITWVPDSNDELGQYDFRVKFADDDDESLWLESIGSFTLMSSELIVVDLTAPQSGYRTETIYVSANASDPNGNEADLTATFQYKGPSGDWVSHDDSNSYFNGAPEYIVDYWRIGFTPPADAELGYYSFRVQFSTATNVSQWETKTNWYNLLNNPPVPIRIDVPSTGFRLESIEISADVSDVETNEGDLITSFHYKEPTGDWISHDDAGSYFVGTPEYIDGSWHIGFVAPEDAELGMYSLRVRFSDGIDERELIIGFKILNNPPATVDLTVPESGNRIETIYVTANGSDVDHIESELVPEFEFKGPGDADWIAQDDTGSYFGGLAEYVDDFWRITFDPPANAELGYYSFRVRFSDGLNTSEWLVENDAFILMNHVPEVSDLSVKDSIYRMETITVSANVTDMDDLEHNLQPTFEYRGPSGTWVSQDDLGNYFTGSPEYIDGQWRIEFEPPDDAPLGAYSFRVRFTDYNDTSDWLTSTDALTVTAHPDDKGEEEPSTWMWLLPLIIALLAILLFIILYTRRKKEPEGGLPGEEGEQPQGKDASLDRQESREEKGPSGEETPTTESRQGSVSEVPKGDFGKPDELHKKRIPPPPPPRR